MSPKHTIADLLRAGEGIHIEYKSAARGLPGNAIETIGAFLNREGGTMLLGVADNGTAEGLDVANARRLCTDLVAVANNPNSLQPIHRLFPELIEYEGKTLIRVDIPQSSQVHTVAKTVYDRSGDGDFRVTDQAALQVLYQRKSSHYTENLVFPYMEMADLRADLFTRVRRIVSLRESRHPWLTLTDEQLLQSAGLWRRDMQTGQQGYTMATALIFGKDETIRNVLPHYDIDALLRRVDTDRYDDRDWMACNLLDAYDRLMNFVAKHLPDPFYLDGTQRVSLRDKIFREVIVNLLVHREYSSAHVARLVIEPTKVVLENANRTYHSGPIDPNNFTPYPKNPNIANFFREIGLMDRLGSGVRNVTRYVQPYAQRAAEFIEGDIFRTAVPVPYLLLPLIFPDPINKTKKQTPDFTANVPLNVPVNVPVMEPVQQRLQQILRDVAAGEIFRAFHWSERLGVSEKTIKRDLKLLRDANLIIFQGPDKTGQYVLTETGQQLFQQSETN